MSDYTVVGLTYHGEVDEEERPVYDGELAVLISHDPFGTESLPLDAPVVPAEAWTTTEWDDACQMVNSLIRADRRYWPPFNPLPATVDDGKLTALFIHADEGDDLGLVARAVQRYGLPTKEAS